MKWFFKQLNLVFPRLERGRHGALKMTVSSVNYQAWLLRFMCLVHNSCSVLVWSEMKYIQAVPVTMCGPGVFWLIILPNPFGNLWAYQKATLPQCLPISSVANQLSSVPTVGWKVEKPKSSQAGWSSTW